MGLFGSRRVTTVGTSVSRVIDDNLLPNAIKTGVYNSLLARDDQLVENVLEEASNSLGVRIRRYYEYGRKHYIHGLPSGTTMTNLEGRDTVAAAIAAAVGSPVELGYYHFGPLNLVHLGWLKLVQEYGYSSADNSLQVNGTKVYLMDMQPVVVEATIDELENGSLDVWGRPPNGGTTPAKPLITADLAAQVLPSPFLTDPNSAQDYILVKHCHEIEEQVMVNDLAMPRKKLIEGQFTLSLSGFDAAANYHQAQYMLAGQTRYWLYQHGSDANPAVEAIFDAPYNGNGTFFPFAYFRLDKQKQNVNKASQEYLTTKKLLKTINMDFDELTDAIHENPDIKDAPNPEMADVEQAMLMLAVPATTDEPIEQRYLFDFFNNLYKSAKVADNSVRNLAEWDTQKNLGMAMPQNTIIIQDARFKMALSWRSISRRRVSGTIGTEAKPVSEVKSRLENKIGERVPSSPDEGAPTQVTWSTTMRSHIYRRQITRFTYEEIEVTGLKMVYRIYGDYTTTADEDDDILLIPLDYAVIQDYSLFDREQITARSLHYVFNSRVVTKLKWYQTGLFRAVLIIAMVVITIVTYGATIEGLIAAIAAGGATATAAYMAIATFLLKYILVSVLIKLFVKVVGVKVAFIAAVVAAIFGMYQVLETGSLQGAPWAKELLQLSSNIASGVSKGVQSEFQDLQNDALTWQREAKSRMELLEKTDDLLSERVYANPMLIMGESPSDFYQRTVHSGNIGILGIEAVSSYVDVQLRLPKISETLGDLV